MTVEWRTVCGWENYEVSSDGQVRVKSKKAPKRTYLHQGYICTQLSRHGFKKRVYVHRLVAAAFCDGDCGLTVDHIDGDRLNNHFSNLQWVDVATNTRLMNQRRAERRQREKESGQNQSAA
jgi:hypothetical protein